MLYWLIAIFHLVIMPLAAVHVLICKRDPRSALGWMGVIVLFPVAGPLLYFFFGINRVRTKAKVFSGRHLPVMYFGYERTTRVPDNYTDPLLASMPHPHIAIVGGKATGNPLVPGNRLNILFNGEQFFPRLIHTIDSAQRCVLLSSYLFSPKGIAGEVIDALSRAAARGVVVRVLIDGVGALYALRGAVRPLRAAGVDVELFTPPRLMPPSLDINLRNHRKIAVIDGHTGFFGGINIDPRHMVTDANNPHPTEDVHFEVHGPAVTDLHQIFAEDWLRVTRKALNPPPQPTAPTGISICRVIDDGPDDTLNHLSMTLLGVFAAAREQITIMVPYFLPAQEMVGALHAAVLRGVRVRVVLPERSNLRFVDWATRNMLWELLAWNIEVYYKPAPFAHTKLILVDNHYVMGGSANLDARSLRLNFELGVEIYDSSIAQPLEQHIQAVIDNSRPLELEELDQRPLWKRVRDAFFWLFSGYL